MPRPSKGPRVTIDSRGMYVIRDGQTNRGTGCYARDGAGAEALAHKKLGEYILAKHDPAKALDRSNPNGSKIADVLALEMKRIAGAVMPDHRKKELITLCENMGNWFGSRTIGDLNGDLQERYARERKRSVMKLVDRKRVIVTTDEPAPIAAYRDLKILAAAINRFFKNKVGGVQTRFSPVLPDAPETRQRWLTRDEAAKILWRAWRARKKTKLDGSKGRHTRRHIARFILVGLYTGSRHGDICGAALIPTIGRGYVDLDRGIFKRKPDNKKETSKKQPTVPIPPRLLAHMRRWKRLGISQKAVIEFNDKPVANISAGWDSMIKDMGLSTDDRKMRIVRHTLRHTAITWYLQPDRRTGKSVDIEIVSQYCGVSVATIRKTYRHVMPGTFDPLLAASNAFGR
jgi:integrase